MHWSNKNLGGHCHENITKLKNLSNDPKNILYCINTKHFFLFFSLFIVTKKTDSNIVNQSGDITAHNY